MRVLIFASILCLALSGVTTAQVIADRVAVLVAGPPLTQRTLPVTGGGAEILGGPALVCLEVIEHGDLEHTDERRVPRRGRVGRAAARV